MKAKNFTTLDTAAADLEWPVYVAGADIDPNGKAVEMRHTRMLGTIASAELSALLAAAPICALPSRYEPFGLCALEAALSGCALVVGDIPSLRENWNDAALFVPPAEASTLNGALGELIAGRKLRDGLAQRAFHRARGFDSRTMGGAYLEVYRNLMQGRVSHEELAYAS